MIYQAPFIPWSDSPVSAQQVIGLKKIHVEWSEVWSLENGILIDLFICALLSIQARVSFLSLYTCYFSYSLDRNDLFSFSVLLYHIDIQSK